MSDDDDYDEYDPINKKIQEEDLDERPYKLKPVIPRKIRGFPKKSNPPSIDQSNENPTKKIKPLDLFKDYLKSYFFTKAIINEYTQLIQSQLGNNIIMNLDDILNSLKNMN